MMTKKATALLALLAILSLDAGAQTDIWKGADPQTKAMLLKVDSLVEQQKYNSAFLALGTEDTNEYVVAKKVELCIAYFVQSIEHTMFAFKDFAPGDTFAKLRTGAGSYSLYPFDPPKVIGPLLGRSRDPGILYLALGDYYYDVSLRYAGRWLESDEEVLKRAAENYGKAYGLGFYTAASLSDYAEEEEKLGDYGTAIELLTKSLALDPKLHNADYNLAYCYQKTGQYELSIASGEKAIEKYKDDPNYRMDALLMNATSAQLLGQYERALGYLELCLRISTEEYRVYQRLGYVYLGLGRLDKADESLDRLFAFAPANPAATQMVMEAYLDMKRPERLQAFFERNIKRYAGQEEVLGNLHFHRGYQYEREGDKEDARKEGQEAKACFLAAGKYSGDAKEVVDALIARDS